MMMKWAPSRKLEKETELSKFILKVFLISFLTFKNC